MVITTKHTYSAPERIGAELREARKAIDCSVRKLAELSAVSDTTIAAIEKGTARSVTMKTLLRIAEHLPASGFYRLVQSCTLTARLDHMINARSKDAVI